MKTQKPAKAYGSKFNITTPGWPCGVQGDTHHRGATDSLVGYINHLYEENQRLKLTTPQGMTGKEVAWFMFAVFAFIVLVIASGGQ